MSYIKVEGSNNLVRDTESGAIININTNEHEQIKTIRSNRKQKDLEFEELKNDVGEIKLLLQQLLEKK